MSPKEIHPVVFFDGHGDEPGIVDMRVVYENVPLMARGIDPKAVAVEPEPEQTYDQGGTLPAGVVEIELDEAADHDVIVKPSKRTAAPD